MSQAGKPLHWADIQQNTFTRWVNEHLRDRGMHCADLAKDLTSGLLLINLMEIISGKSVGRYNKHPKVPQQKSENCDIAIKFIEAEGIKLVNIGGRDINDGKLKLILGLIWTLILRYEVNKGGQGGEDELLKWVQSKIPEYNIKGWTSDWNNGKAVCALVDALRPGYIPNHRTLSDKDALNNAELGISTAERRLGVNRLIEPAEMCHPKVDKQSMVTYIAQFRNLTDFNSAEFVSAYGSGLVDGVVNQESSFHVDVPENMPGKLVVRVEGPNDDAKVQITKNGSNYEVKYTPTVAGIYKIHITYDGNHIPGSIFTVIVRDYESLGGEGKIIVFFSTTSSSEKGRQDVFKLETLLTSKKIHERPDFEPWTPVDLMDREDREAVFRRAGTRNLPIVFIDDVYVGDYDTLERANEVGKLDQMLKTMQHSNLYDRDQGLLGNKATKPNNTYSSVNAATKGVANMQIGNNNNTK